MDVLFKSKLVHVEAYWKFLKSICQKPIKGSPGTCTKEVVENMKFHLFMTV